jgi:two-component system, NarL family, nitrate/nitrite response regulator NarL
MSARPIRVMLVDDHRSVLWGLAKLIDSAGDDLRTVATADCHETAMQRMAEHAPDVVLMDLDLGAGAQAGIDGIAILSTRGARIIALTGARDPELQERAVRAGARGFVHKSEPAETILKAVARVHAGELWLDHATVARLVNSLSQAPSRAQADPADSLTPTERRVIAEVVRHKSLPNKVIADALDISTHTLRNHLASIYGKLSLHRRLELVLFAIERKLA